VLIAAAREASTGSDWKFMLGLATAIVGIIALWVNGSRAERRRRRELYAGGWAAVQAYKELAFAVRRRRHDDPAGERVRVSEALRDVQKDLAYHDALIANERSGRIATDYRNLVTKAREIAGGVIREGWNTEPITDDTQMHAPDIAEKLMPLERFEDAYQTAVRDDLAWWRDFSPRGR
jgi:hypothetical protein